jgi:OmpA-OmpF porin, OOP family
MQKMPDTHFFYLLLKWYCVPRQGTVTLCHIIKLLQMKQLFAVLLLLLTAGGADAQFGNLLDRAKQKVDQKVNQKIDQKLDKAADKAVDGVDDAASGKNKGKTKSKDNNSNAGNDESGNSGGSSGKSSGTGFKSYSKFDFVPGEKIIAQEDFSQDNIGDFPDKWNTNASGEIVTIDGTPGKWLAMTKPGVYYPEFLNNLPENFTIEYDVAANETYSFYSASLLIGIARASDAKGTFNAWKAFGHGRDGIAIRVHPQAAGGSTGSYSYTVYEKGEETMKSDGAQSNFTNKNFTAHISIWRQKSRIRVYINQEKVIDLPKALTGTYSKIVFTPDYSYHRNEDILHIANLRVAVGAPDTRNKLITEGKFVTHGILFDVNSATIKAASYGTLKDIANVLKENADVKVKIVGHTDADGDDKANMELSKKRAEAVKTMLSKEFGIDADRMETDGKGESQPTDKNTTNEGKANNRRVEFIKI